MLKYYAHSLKNQPVEKWQLLEEHLQNVEKLAGVFAEEFGSKEWGALAGLWHDVGKYGNSFQEMLLRENGFETDPSLHLGKVVHSNVGGHLAQLKMDPGFDRILCWIIMGHHAGLTDFGSDNVGSKSLEVKMRSPKNSECIIKTIPEVLINKQKLEIPMILQRKPQADISFFIRMLFSCLVDADFLDTEKFMSNEKYNLRETLCCELSDLLVDFNVFMKNKCDLSPKTDINLIRQDILNQCLQKANQEPSVFSLTVPTGGGKTLSSLAFALSHAKKYKKKRIIYVIPYTSIIEQTAQVFREIPGFADAVVEHHCNLVNDEEKKENIISRLMTENWDAPIIVTTSVQFFESLYACKTSRCRKLHNIVNSVVIFDEPQTIPPEFLRPIVFSIRELYRHYRVTPVFCSATQPVLTKTESFDFNIKEGFDNVIEIIDNPIVLHSKLKRVEIETFQDLEAVSLEKVAYAIAKEDCSVLCIVNSKRDAKTLAGLLPIERTIHLSTNMCAEHRTSVLNKIKVRLKDKNESPFYVVSTSLVEAGVDLDFETVYRALAGLDSIAQAAGRCNREGKMSEFGRTIVFLPEEQPDYIKNQASLAEKYFRNGNLKNIFEPKVFTEYFSQRFFCLGESALDKHKILNLLSGNLNYSFRTAAERFSIIDDDWQRSIIVPYGGAQEIIDKLITEHWASHKYLRQLQRYTVSISKREFQYLLESEYLSVYDDFPNIYSLFDMNFYSEKFGYMSPNDVDAYNVETLIA
jgi:CRISPR-associated endonuclease/helicase Cas3